MNKKVLSVSIDNLCNDASSNDIVHATNVINYDINVKQEKKEEKFVEIIFILT